MIHVNAHLHTPYSFSAFSGIDDALDRAAAEGVKVVGINDFYSMDGYAAWREGCSRRGLFPLLGIEFIALNAADQAEGLRVNDPNNPGRTYLSGKGLAFPVVLGGEEARLLAEVRAESNLQVERMCAALNSHLASVGAGFSLDFNEIRETLTCGSIRERHLAKALRLAVERHSECHSERSEESLYARILGRPLTADPSDPAAVENELRSRLLKAGGAAFVPEDPKAFLPTETVQRIILAAGGIPTYPFLADDAKGNFTDFEADLQKAADTLKKRGIKSAEFITTRNTTAVLESYAGYLEDEGFIVTFGSEHNTPKMEPVRLRTRDSAELSSRLLEINWRGACAVAARQAGLDSPAAGEELIYSAISR